MSHRALSPQQFDLAQVAGLHPSLGGEEVPDVIRGRVATHVMHQADIRQTRVTGKSYGGHDERVDAPHITGAADVWELVIPRGEVWTSQGHLHVPTLKHYMEHGPPGEQPRLPEYPDMGTSPKRMSMVEDVDS